MLSLYTNYQITQICKEVAEYCPISPNVCCNNYNPTNPERCGKKTDCLLWTEDYLGWEKPGLLRFFVFMLAQFVLQFSAILVYEAGWLRFINYKLLWPCRRGRERTTIKVAANVEHHVTMNGDECEAFADIAKDSDVLDEEKRIDTLAADPSAICSRGGATDEIFVVHRLTKHYANFMAVKGVSFTLRKAESFGLLGTHLFLN